MKNLLVMQENEQENFYQGAWLMCPMQHHKTHSTTHINL